MADLKIDKKEIGVLEYDKDGKPIGFRYLDGRLITKGVFTGFKTAEAYCIPKEFGGPTLTLWQRFKRWVRR